MVVRCRTSGHVSASPTLSPGHSTNSRDRKMQKLRRNKEPGGGAATLDGRGGGNNSAARGHSASILAVVLGLVLAGRT